MTEQSAQGEFTVLCSWCWAAGTLTLLSGPKPDGRTPVSHGACRGCAEQLMAEFELHYPSPKEPHHA